MAWVSRASTTFEARSSSLADFNCANVTEIPNSECEALVAFYNRLDGDNWSNNSGWLSTNTPCDWNGVYCRAGHVVQIVQTGDCYFDCIPGG